MTDPSFYERGDRVTLVATADPDAPVSPGATGTVWRHHPHQTSVTVHWDNGTTQTLHPYDADTLELLPQHPAGWARTLEHLAAVGERDGEETARRWTASTFGGRDHREAVVTATRLIDGIEQQRPGVLAELPLWQQEPPAGTAADLAGPELTPEEWWARVAPAGAPGWDTLTGAQRGAAITGYGDAHDEVVLGQIHAHCLLAASPIGDGRDLSYLDPDDLTLGRIGVFTGDWHSYLPDRAHSYRYTVGFIGVLIDRWNGFAVYSCSREVAEAIVAAQEPVRAQIRQVHLDRGIAQDEADQLVDASCARLSFDGDTLLVDERAMYEDPDALDRITANRDGQWVVMGWNWTWDAVPAYRCDRIVGAIPDPADRQAWVPLAHIPAARVPHARLRLTPLTAGRDRAVFGTLGVVEDDAIELDGAQVGAAHTDPADATRMTWQWEPDASFGAADFTAFTQASRMRGEPVTEAQLMTLLATDAAVAETLDQAQTRGATLARLLDTTGYPIQIHRVWPAPASRTARETAGRALARRHRAADGSQWEIWTPAGDWAYAARAQTPATPREATDAHPDQAATVASVLLAGVLDAAGRADLIDLAADHGVLLDPDMTSSAMREALQAAIGTGLDDEIRAADPAIDTIGWTVVTIAPGTAAPEAGTAPGFAYTVGLTAAGHPELLLAGLPPQTSGPLLNGLARRVHDDGERLRPGQMITGLTPETTVVLVEGPASQELYPAAAIARYGLGAVRLLQLVWPDPDGRYPWDEGYAHDQRPQPLLAYPDTSDPDDPAPQTPMSPDADQP